MPLSTKQEIYVQIFNLVLPYVRDMKALPLWDKRIFWSFYEDMELVHNIGYNLPYPEFKASDVHWLNAQARRFIKYGHRSPYYEEIVKHIRQLFIMVPDELRSLLQWEGP